MLLLSCEEKSYSKVRLGETILFKSSYSFAVLTSVQLGKGHFWFLDKQRKFFNTRTSSVGLFRRSRIFCHLEDSSKLAESLNLLRVLRKFWKIRDCYMWYFCLASFWVVLLLAPRGFRVRSWKKLLLFGLTFSLLYLYLRIGLPTLNVVRFRNYLVCSCIFHTESSDPARTCRPAWNYIALRNTDIDWEIKLINCKA